MKPLKDNTEVPSRCYYYMLDWNEENEGREMADRFNLVRLMDLTWDQFWELFRFAIAEDTPKITYKDI
jgi:hypothetical protein